MGILKKLRTPEESKKTPVEVPLLPTPTDDIQETDMMLDLETSEHEDNNTNEASNSSETLRKIVKTDDNSATREKQRRMQHDFFNSMSKSRQPGDVPLRKAHAHSLIKKSQGGSGAGSSPKN